LSTKYAKDTKIENRKNINSMQRSSIPLTLPSPPNRGRGDKIRSQSSATNERMHAAMSGSFGCSRREPAGQCVPGLEPWNECDGALERVLNADD